MAKVKIGALRQLHSHLTDILGAYDAAKAKDEDDSDAPQGDVASAQAKLAAGHAQDGVPMYIAFPGFNRNRPKY
jgi:hypothetical protein